MKTIRPTDLQNLLAAQPDLTVLDVRTPVEFAVGHVPQARNVPLDQFSPQALVNAGQLPKDQPVYLLCRSGGRATQAAEKLAKEGFDNAVVVEGGTLAWIEAGPPVQRATGKGISLERQVRMIAGSLMLTSLVLAWLVHPYFLALSAFVGAGLVLSGITGWCGMALLLARLPGNAKA